jgi:hypothetical protein
LCQHPGDSHQCYHHLARITQLFELVYGLHLRFLPVAGTIELPGILKCKARSLLDRLPSLIVPGEQTTRQWIVADRADALIPGQREEFRLNVTEQ